MEKMKVMKVMKVMRTSRYPPPVEIMTDQTQLQTVEYFSCFGSITNDARCTSEIKCMIAMAKASFNKNKTISPANWTTTHGRSNRSAIFTT